MQNLIYAIKVGSASYGDLTILEVKIGRTSNIKSTKSQYQRSHILVEILNLWETNEKLSASECETGVHLIAGKYSYERDSEKFIFLQDSYTEFAENVSKLLNNTSEERLEKKPRKEKKAIKKGYTSRKPKFVKFKNKTYRVKTWREVLQRIAEHIYNETEDFDKVVNIKGRTREYFSKSGKEKRHGGDLIHPQKINGTPFYFECNISANRTMTLVNRLLALFGYKESDLEIGYK